MTDRFLIVGLGNPGREYKGNRHNIGFQVVDVMAARHGISFSRSRNDALIADGRIAGLPVLLAKPQTYMNNSGRSVAGLMRFFKLENDHLIVIYDDLDLPTGTLRMRPAGGAGGQNGMRDIIRHQGEDFARLRVGIDRPPGKMPAQAYVLQDFAKNEEAIMSETREKACDAIEQWMRDGIDLAMSRFNGPPATS